MQTMRITLGAVLLLMVATATLGGVWVLRQSGGGGLSVRVMFEDTKNLRADDDVIYGDAIVGRIESVESGTVIARIATDHARLVHEGSRFWIQSGPAMAILVFDTPMLSGGNVEPGHEFKGLAEQPEPDPKLAPAPMPRTLTDRPPWLCEVRSTLELNTEWTETQRRKSAAVIASVRDNGDLIVLAPGWVTEYSGELADERYRVELISGDTLVAELVVTRLPWAVFLVRETAYADVAAPFWPDALGEGQGLVLTDLEGDAFAATYVDGGIDLPADTGQGLLALIEGFNVAGFTLPNVGADTGVRWQPLNGAGSAIEEARTKLD
ncbi:MAG: hypothetical protein KDB68_10630 [Planctomycetes bacterium]|nr:hypothetical protein [Planctomycetota bacterium]